MYKKIGHSFVYLFLFAGLYGCSCSENPNAGNSKLEPGLYIASINWNEDAGDISFPINLQRDSSETVTVTYEITERIEPQAKAGLDFTAKSDTLTFSADSNDTQNIVIAINDDDLYEHDESFLVKLTAASGAKIVNAQAIVTIIDNEPKPVATLSIVDSPSGNTLAESAADRVQLGIALDKVSGVDAHINIQKSEESSALGNGGEVAAERVDYILKYEDGSLIESNERIIIPAGETSILMNMDIIDDGIVENIERFSLQLAAVTDVATNSIILDFEITDDDQQQDSVVFNIPLNDTGVRELPSVTVPLEETTGTDVDPSIVREQWITDLQLQMDYKAGRDAAAASQALTKIGGGRAGFDFTRLNEDGSLSSEEGLIAETVFVLDNKGKKVPVLNELGEQVLDDMGDPVFQTKEVSTVPWACVRDNNTGLIWEVKLNSNLGLRAQSRNFHWFDPSFTTNGGSSGDKGEFLCAETDLSECNTAYYVADINASKLCGLTGWRLPTMNELRSIFDYGVTSKATPIYYDTDYFAAQGAFSKYYWSSNTFELDTTKAWVMYFGSGKHEDVRDKTSAIGGGIRLVNDTLLKQQQQLKAGGE